MSLNDPLANALSLLLNAEGTGRVDCLVTPSSKTVKKVLLVLKDEGYIGNVEEVEEGKGLKVTLSGNINKCGVIKPRYNVAFAGFEKFERRYLPSKHMGIIVLTTPKGIITHKQAKDQHTGGKLLAYCY